MRQGVVSVLWLVGSGLTGYLLLLAVTPNPDEMKKKFPEANPAYYKAERERNKTFMQVLKKAAESDEPIYRKGIKKQ